MAYENNDKKNESVYSKRIRAGKRRTYFFDVRETRGSDYFLTITESRKRFDSEGYDRHKIFVYKEDFNKFVKGLNEAVDYVKTELMPDFDFDAFNHDTPYEAEGGGGEHAANTETEHPVVIAPLADEIKPVEDTAPVPSASAGDNGATEEVDKW
ncbi:MAG: DUF3276 family protein [Ferruginibacter sp.]